MSGYLDALSGAGFDGSESGGIGAVGAMATDASGGGYFSGVAQSMAAIGTGALSKWVDLELYRKAQGMQPMPVLGTTQNGVLIRNAGLPVSGNVGVVQNGTGGQTMLNLNALMPFLLVAAAVFFVAKKV